MKSQAPTQPKDARAAKAVRESEARKVAAGGRRMPGGVLPADAASALEVLQNEQYAGSASACIARALIEAADNIKRIATK